MTTEGVQMYAEQVITTVLRVYITLESQNA
jgi:hypothetical protein